MGIVLKFKDDAAKRVPAVVHFDGSARLQTVTRDSGWYYDFIKKWNEVSGVPVVLNTSFNDREPICETPEHALQCFLGTEIDYLYFPEFSILVSRRQ
jgi:carbamoyltransferase